METAQRESVKKTGESKFGQVSHEEEKERYRNGDEMCDPTKTEDEDLLSDDCD